jgi:hypothetical protein
MKGNLIGNRLEYRLGAFQGFKQTFGEGESAVEIGSNSPRFAGRLQYNFLTPEAPTFFYTGSYFGKQKTFAVGASADVQGEYHSLAGDVFLDYPVGPGGLTVQGDYVHYDAAKFYTVAPRQNFWMVEAGYHLPKYKFTPWVKFEGLNYENNTTANAGDETRWQVGASYYVMGNTLNVKAGYGQNTFERLDAPSLKQNTFTMQLQAFLY